MSTSRHWKSGGFQRVLLNRKRRIAVRLRERGLGVGHLGAMHALARESGLIEAIDRRPHLPYHESDHVLNIAYPGVEEQPIESE